MEHKKITKSLSVARELTPELKQRHDNDENGFWIYASREVTDSMGDIIRIDGISLAPYHNPPESHLKVLAQHLRVLPDGTAPVVGVVTDYVKTVVPYNKQMVKALCLYVSWLRDEQGELLPLSQHYYEMMNSQPVPGIDSGSVGIIVEEFTPMENGGMDITKCSEFEFSLVTVPANASATTIKELEDRFGDLLVKDEPTPTPAVTAEQDDEKPDDSADAQHSLIGEQWQAAMTQALAPVNESLRQISERLDLLESALVVLTQPAKAQGEDDTNEDEPLPVESMATLTAELKGLLKQLQP